MSFDKPTEFVWNNSESPLNEEYFNNQNFIQDLNLQNIALLNHTHTECPLSFELPTGPKLLHQQLFNPASPNPSLQQMQQNNNIVHGGFNQTAYFPQTPAFAQSISSRSSPSTEKSMFDHTKVGVSPASNILENEKLSKLPAATSSNNKKRTLDEQDTLLMARDDSDLTEEELSAKKKAQNRAAQRAFRERKENKLKVLEEKLNKSEAENQKLLDQLTYFRSQNEKQQQLLISAENNSNIETLIPANDKFVFPTDISQTSFIDRMAAGHEISNNAELLKIYRAPDSPDTQLLTIGAVWDYLHLKAEELEREDQFFDVVGIMERLKGNEKCHGFGPAYPVELVDQAILESIRE